MDTYIWYAVGAAVIGFLFWWLPQDSKPLLSSPERDDSPLDDGDGD